MGREGECVPVYCDMGGGRIGVGVVVVEVEFLVPNFENALDSVRDANRESAIRIT